jgi:hypothetical protein
MTSTTEPDVCQELLSRAKNRLLSVSAMQPPFQGPWCDALVKRLEALVRENMDDELQLPRRVVTCYADIDVRDIAALFQAMREAGVKAAPSSEDERHWLTELTCFAFLRTLQPDFVCKYAAGLTQTRAARQGHAALPIDTALMASMTYTQLVLPGLRFSGGDLGWKGKWLDLPQFADSTDTVHAILSALVEQLPPEAGGRRRNPDDPIEERDLDRLLAPARMQLGDAIRRSEASGICVRRPKALPDDQWAAILQAVSERLKAHVVGYENQSHKSLARIETSLLPEDLELQLRVIFAQISGPVTVRKQPSSAYETESFEFDFFLSHASEDKAGFVDPLAEGLSDLGWRIWYDKQQLMVGDSLIGSIEQGLRRSRYVVFVVSPNSLTKPGWVEAEWESVLSRQTSLGEKRVLPVWLDVSMKEVSERHPFLARYLAANGSKGVADVVLQLDKTAKRGGVRK